MIDASRIFQKQLVTPERGRFSLRNWTSNESSYILGLPSAYSKTHANLEIPEKTLLEKRSVSYRNAVKIASFLRFPILKRITIKEKGFDPETIAQRHCKDF